MIGGAVTWTVVLRAQLVVVLLTIVPLVLAAQTRVTAGASKDSVFVGMPYTLTVRVRTAPQAVVEFPAAPDSGSAVRLLDPRTVSVETFADSTLHYGIYRLAAWDVNTRSARIGNVLVSEAGRVQQFTIPFPLVHVAAVLPADSTTHVPRPARLLFPATRSWWHPWVPLIALLGTLILIYSWWRARRLVVRATTSRSRVADYSFKDIEAMGLPELGEFGRHATLMIDAMKTGIAARLSLTGALSNHELLLLLADDGSISTAQVAALLEWGDRIKFAGIPVSKDEALEISRQAKELDSRVAMTVARDELQLQGESVG